MFVGHYGISFAAKQANPSVPLYVFFGPPPVSDKAAAVTALLSYAAFPFVIRALERRTAPSP